MQEVVISTSDGRCSFHMNASFCILSGVSHENIATVEVFMCSWLALLSDSPLNSSHGLKPRRLYSRFLSRILSNGLIATVNEFSSLAHKLASSAYLMGTSDLNSEFIDEFKNTPVFKEYHQYYKDEDPSLFKFLYTFLTFGKKMPYIDPEYEKVAFRNWLDLETRISTWDYDSVDLESIRLILDKTLPPLTLDGFFPKFGPGSVSEKGVRGRIRKVEAFKYDPIIDRFIYNGHLGHYGFGESLGLSSKRTVPNCSSWTKKRRIASRLSRLRFVPKDLKTSRSICMESNVLQYFQQGVLDRMLATIKRTMFNSIIRFSDQSFNRSLAEFGSYTGEIDTIDLSSASDSVTMTLVNNVFPRSWLIAMRATRSSRCILPNGKIHYLNKFAPMGSALCFPTQSLIFASVCIYAELLFLHRLTDHTLSFTDWLRSIDICEAIRRFRVAPTSYPTDGTFQPLGVYGDDICVDRRLTQDVISILVRLGFTVNVNKSFMGSQAFRESCGGFYLNGVEVNPMYYRIKYSRFGLRAESCASIVALANKCFFQSYNTLRCFMTRLALYGKSSFGSPSHKNPFLFVSPDDDRFGLVSPYPYNQHLRYRNNQSYQRQEYKCIGLIYKYLRVDKRYLLDEYEYMRWMGTHRGETSDPVEGSHSYEAGGARMCWRWTPVIQ